MKRQVRRGVFETNSSSTHSITMCMKYDSDLMEMENMISEKIQLIEDGEETKEDIEEVEYWFSNMKY